MELKETLMEGAKDGGICADGYGKIRAYDRDEVIDYYLGNLDWCMERGFPSLKLLRREFSDIEDRGVYVCKEFNGEVFSARQAYIFHACKGTIKVAMDYEKAIIPMLYFANGCDIRVECDQPNDPPIRVPLYISADSDVVGGRSEGCTYTRKTIKRVRR